MAVYAFKGISAAGKAISGIRDADNPKSLRSALRKEGVFPTDIVEQKQGSAARREINLRRGFERIGAAEISIMTRNLATLLGSGITLVESLSALVDQTENERLKVVLAQIKQDVNSGFTLADALAKHGKIYSNLYINMVRAGESSGALDVVLVRLADYTEDQAKLRQKVLGTLMYPVIMMIVGIAILAILFVVVVPKLTKIFEDVKVTLPIYTRILIGTSNLLKEHGIYLILLAALCVFGFIKWKNSARGRATWDRVILRAPVFGVILRMLSIARFSRTLATLLQSGVELLNALNIVRNIVDNSVLQKVIEDTRLSVKEGEPIAQPLKRSGQFPPLVTHMVAVGERSGQLEHMLLKVAEAYEAQVEVRIGALTTLLEPLMIVLMGGTVAFVVMSILMPILKISEFVK